EPKAEFRFVSVVDNSVVVVVIYIMCSVLQAFDVLHSCIDRLSFPLALRLLLKSLRSLGNETPLMFPNSASRVPPTPGNDGLLKISLFSGWPWPSFQPYELKEGDLNPSQAVAHAQAAARGAKALQDSRRADWHYADHIGGCGRRLEKQASRIADVHTSN
ncbi:unnamed protein product, partial [marine sediment metagenome]